MRLAWWREAIAGERRAEAAGNPVALALRAAIDDYALPLAWLEAMLDARLQAIAPQEDFNLAAFRAFADESEGARLRLAARIAAEGQDLDPANAQAPAGMALALTRLMSSLLFGIKPTDPATFAVVAIGLLSAAAVSSYLPARRAAAVDPVEAMRAE